MSVDLYCELLSLLGKTESSPEFQLFLNKPIDSKVEVFKTPAAVHYMLMDHGVILHFQTGSNSLNLIFLALATEMVKSNNMKPFCGVLPSKITHEDDREEVKSKLAMEPIERKSPGKTAADPLDNLDFYNLNGVEHCFSFRGATGEMTSLCLNLNTRVS